MNDSYEKFLMTFARKTISRDAFIKYGINSVVMVSDESALAELEKSIQLLRSNKRSIVFAIRRYGKYSENNNPYIKLYKKIWGVRFKQDHDNNKYPKEAFKKIRPSIENGENYQCAHVWGKTKNPIMFTALFNVVFIPKMFDPLTGHETKGSLADEFRTRFVKNVKARFPKSVARYNDFVCELDMAAKIDEYCKKYVQSVPNGFCARVKKEWETI